MKGSTYRFIADPIQPQPVVEWLRTLSFPPQEVTNEGGIVLYFRARGNLSYATDGTIISDESPVATLHLPRGERSVLWTVGELNFRAIRLLERFPDLAKIRGSFSKWLNSQTCVWSGKTDDDEFSYFLEGYVRNGPPVHMLFPPAWTLSGPGGMLAPITTTNVFWKDHVPCSDFAAQVATKLSKQ